MKNFFKIILVISIILISSCKPMYRVEFKSKITGYKGHGNWFSDSLLVDVWIRYGNQEYPEIKHEIGVKK